MVLLRGGVWHIPTTDMMYYYVMYGTVILNMENERGCGREEDGGWMMVRGEEKESKKQ